MDKLLLMAGANLLLAAAIFFTALCRLIASSTSVRIAVRVKYALIVGAAVASGLAPLAWTEYPGYSMLIVNGVWLASLWIETIRWWNGPPIDVLKREKLPNILILD